MSIQSLQIEISDLKAEIQNWKDRQAAYCPDGVPFEDYIATLRAENERLKAPVSDEEWAAIPKLIGHYKANYSSRDELDALIAARAKERP